ncbi:DUF305 domain-containing protein [Mangrovibrevibacter kandeliae]|uniref:DUF305 domain-containing protein n=1 Tax=Mangrovibrevibacter kandeliae TaxID=2968473 RepID=UPI0021192BF0|nr:DUF305 domain-containing protein [Aurantimonas sp. CSK15Z-1]
MSPALAQADHAAGHADAAALPAACEAAAATSSTPKGDAHMMTGGAMNGAPSVGPMADWETSMMRAATIMDPDLAFNCGMIAHHMGAIAMAEAELHAGKDHASRAMAAEIISTQRKEIDEMTKRITALTKK